MKTFTDKYYNTVVLLFLLNKNHNIHTISIRWIYYAFPRNLTKVYTERIYKANKTCRTPFNNVYINLAYGIHVYETQRGLHRTLAHDEWNTRLNKRFISPSLSGPSFPLSLYFSMKKSNSTQQFVAFFFFFSFVVGEKPFTTTTTARIHRDRRRQDDERIKDYCLAS